MEIQNISTVSRFNIVRVAGIESGKAKSYDLTPLEIDGKDKDISKETDDVKATCTKAWTPEVVEAYRLHLESTV